MFHKQHDLAFIIDAFKINLGVGLAMLIEVRVFLVIILAVST
jgi:hypothetical protein